MFPRKTLLFLLWLPLITKAQTDSLSDKILLIRKNIYANYKGMFREPGGALKYPFITPGSSSYSNDLWDWDSWLSNIALRQILTDVVREQEKNKSLKYEQGCVLNFLEYTSFDGYMPILVAKKSDPEKIKPQNIYTTNMHKPVIAQHAAFLIRETGESEWLKEKFSLMQAFISNYQAHHRHKATGLYYWQDDLAIGVDTDPATFFRPPASSASIFLNCLMYKELKAMVYIAQQLKLPSVATEFENDANELKYAIQKHCWDEKDGFFYSVDINLRPVTNEPSTIFGQRFILHSGFPRTYDGIIQRIGTWSGFLAMWAEIATPEQAQRMVKENFNDERTFKAPFGVRTLSKLEKMYSVRASNNPSNWLGPIWGISNYLVFRGLVKYNFNKEAKELAVKTVSLFGNDISKSGELHEYYDPETGEPILNKGFQNWNYLVTNMMNWMQGKAVVEEF